VAKCEQRTLMQTRQLSAHDLEDIVGPDHVHKAAAHDSIDGVQPRWVLEPGSVEEISALLRLANDSGCAVIPRGSGTKMGLGNPPRAVDLILSTSRLNRVLEHAAGDLVVRVEAGARLRDVQAELATANQWLALDPPEPDATIGGIIVANAFGPRRLRYGGVRDLLIGITYVLPDGTVARSGGKVVKNVAGYDLNKLFTGSLGTLGLIVEAIFRLHPLPAATRTDFWIRGGGSPRELGEVTQLILHSNLVPSALDYSWSRRISRLAVRFDGIEPGVDAQVQALEAMLEGRSQVQTDVDASIWEPGKMLSPIRRSGETRMKVSEALANLPVLIEDFEAIVLGGNPRPAPQRGRLYAEEIPYREPGKELTGHIRGHAGNGISYIGIAGPAELQIEAVEALRSRVTQRGGSLVVTDAPVEVKRAIDVWGDVGSALPLMRRVKQMFDPNGIMNSGRFVGGI
jgi:glycolate oxidase FAD binding subunit